MTVPLSLLITTANRSYIFVSFAFSTQDNANQNRKSLTDLSVEKLYARLEIKGGDGDRKVWRQLSAEDARNAIHADLYPIVRRILVGPNGQEANTAQRSSTVTGQHFRGTPPFRMEPGILPQEYVLTLTKRARERLENHGPEYAKLGLLPFRLEDVRVYLPGTGVGLLCFAIEFTNPFSSSTADIPAEVVVEGVTALCRGKVRKQSLRAARLELRKALKPIAAGDRVSYRHDQDHGVSRLVGEEERKEQAGIAREDIAKDATGIIEVPHKLGEMTLVKLAYALIGLKLAPEEPPPGPLFLGPTESGRSHNRLFSFSALQIPSGVLENDAAKLCYGLAHKFTTDYGILDEQIEEATVRPFTKVRHCMATQGGAVVTVDNNTDFLRNYIGQAVVPTYLPLAVLAFHEYLQLRHLISTERYAWENVGDDSEEACLEALQKHLVNFRLWYRFSHVSDLSHHNRVFQQWRRALGLDHMLDELSRDAAEGERVLLNIREKKEGLHRKMEDRRERQHRMAFLVLSVLGIFFVLNEAIELLGKVFLLPPTETVVMLERTIDLLDKSGGSPDFLQAVTNVRSQLTDIVHDLHTIHFLEIGAFILAVILALFSLWFIFRYRKSPLGGGE